MVDQLILALRRDFKMLAVSSAWLRFGQPEALFDENERKYGIHGGDIETSLMLHYAPNKVDMSRAQNFQNSLQEIEAQSKHLSGYGKHHFGWMSDDLTLRVLLATQTQQRLKKALRVLRMLLRAFF